MMSDPHLEPRCRVCRNDAVRQKVNDLLAGAASYATIARTLEEENSKLDVRDRVTVDSIRNHCARHFPVQNAAKAVYREIIERRAKEAGIDFVNGVTTALTPVAYFETILVKSFESLKSDVKVDVATGMTAASRLQAIIIDSRSGQTDIADVFVKQNRIIEAMREFIPADDLPAFLARLDGSPAPMTGSPTETTEVEEFDPDFGDDDDDDELD
jgi:hypothetical protein